MATNGKRRKAKAPRRDIEYIMVRCTLADKRRYQGAAQKAGYMNLSPYVRFLLEQQLKQLAAA
jgi:hypothetical protein